jgi:hypothetical protein
MSGPGGNYFTTNLGLAVLPEVDQRKYPDIYTEFLRIRTAVQVLQVGLDAYTGVMEATALTDISVGQIINIFDIAGVAWARLADANSLVVPGQAFCNASVLANQIGHFSLSGIMPYFSGLIPGTIYYLSLVPGSLTTIAPVGAGQLEQELGVAINSTTIWFSPGRRYIPH